MQKNKEAIKKAMANLINKKVQKDHCESIVREVKTRRLDDNVKCFQYFACCIFFVAHLISCIKLSHRLFQRINCC